MGRLTTHVLDTSLGKPAAGMRLALFRLKVGSRAPICDAITNADGRCDAPLLEGDQFRIGEYELVFQAAEYFSASGTPLSEPPFLREVVLRFGIGDVAQNYHVPLLISPWSYSTYRGS